MCLRTDIRGWHCGWDPAVGDPPQVALSTGSVGLPCVLPTRPLWGSMFGTRYRQFITTAGTVRSGVVKVQQIVAECLQGSGRVILGCLSIARHSLM